MAAGVGGGGVSTPLILFFLKFTFSDSVALSKTAIFFGAFARYCMDVFKRSPVKGDAHKPLIHYEIVMLFEPVMLSGTVVGVIINVFFPEWILMILMILVIL